MTFSELLADDNKIIFFDGAMGTLLGQMGCEMGALSSLSSPDAVLDIHRQYVAAGAHLLTANTFTMNRIYNESHNIDVDIREANLAGMSLAQEIASEANLNVDGEEFYILGDMGSTGKMLKPYGPISEEEVYECFCEQAAILTDGGADALAIETMFDLKEALCAVRAAKEASDLPVLATMSFNTANNGGRTIMGDTAVECARALTEAGADAIGANCGLIDPHEMSEIIAQMRTSTELPLIAQPNAGKARQEGKDFFYDMTPADFAGGLEECHLAGARLLGGCCGTTPAHIKALVERINDFYR